MSLKEKAIKGTKWSILSAAASASIQLIQITVLVRLLSKEDFGIMAMAVFVIGISQIFMDMGISNAVIYKQQVSSRELSTLYWLNILLGIIIYTVILVAASLISVFYNTPELTGVLQIIGLTFLIQPFGQLFDTMLRKELAFRALAARDILSKMIGLMASIFFAYKGFGVYSLVYANLLSALIATILLIIAGLKNFTPALIFSFREVKEQGYLKFGLYQIGEKIINYFNANLDTLIIGKLLGMNALGLYNIAKTIAFRPFMVINPVITKVLFPVLAQLQGDLTKMKQVFLRMIRLLTTTNAPIYIGMIIFATPLVSLFFGRAWLSSVPVMQYLALNGLLISILNPIGALQLARGRADLGFYWNVLMLLSVPLFIWIGHYWGITGVAIGLFSVRLLAVFPSWAFFIKPLSGASLMEFTLCWLRPVCWSVISGCIALVVTQNIENSYILLLIGAITALVVYISINYVLEKYIIRDIKSFLNLKPKEE